MTWATTLVEPVDPSDPTVVQVVCRWCRWRSVSIDVVTERARVWVRSIRTSHECAADNPERAFADIVAEADGSALYAAVLEMEQHYPGDLPVIIGMKAWSQLDERQQRQHFNDLLKAYVELVQIQRAEPVGGGPGER